MPKQNWAIWTLYSRYILLVYLTQKKKQNKFITRWRNCDYFICYTNRVCCSFLLNLITQFFAELLERFCYYIVVGLVYVKGNLKLLSLWTRKASTELTWPFITKENSLKSNMTGNRAGRISVRRTQHFRKLELVAKSAIAGYRAVGLKLVPNWPI